MLSRGLVVLFPEPVNQKAEAVMISNGIRMDGYMSKQLTREDMGDACLVLTLNEKQKERINEEYPEQKLVYRLWPMLRAGRKNGEADDRPAEKRTQYLTVGRCTSEKACRGIASCAGVSMSCVVRDTNE